MELFMVHISHFGINTSWKFSNKNWVTLVITHISKGVSMHHPGLGGIPTPCGALRRPAAPCGALRPSRNRRSPWALPSPRRCPPRSRTSRLENDGFTTGWSPPSDVNVGLETITKPGTPINYLVISIIKHRIQPLIRQLNAIDWGPHPVSKPF